MSAVISEKQKYDPWEAQQEITNVKIVLHRCRYWMLSEWECENLSLPFWRLYHSRTGGSSVKFADKEVEISSEKLILIPPYTAFSSQIKGVSVPQHESIKGCIIEDEHEITAYQKAGMCDQFFTHFNLGYPFDKIKANIYEIELPGYWMNELLQLEHGLISEPNCISFITNLHISSLIIFALRNISPEHWQFPETDERVLKIMSYIDKNLSRELTNSELAKESNLATNSFARIFKGSINVPVQQYIQHKRIEKAIMLIHHSNMAIDEIAQQCGFCDRHHFSKIFRKQTGLPPVLYRKKNVLK